jgi:hypothetical protein
MRWTSENVRGNAATIRRRFPRFGRLPTGITVASLHRGKGLRDGRAARRRGRDRVTKPEFPYGSRIQRTMRLLVTSTPQQRNRVKILYYGQSIIAQNWWKAIVADLRERFPNADIVATNPSIGGLHSQRYRLGFPAFLCQGRRSRTRLASPNPGREPCPRPNRSCVRSGGDNVGAVADHETRHTREMPCS